MTAGISRHGKAAPRTSSTMSPATPADTGTAPTASIRERKTQEEPASAWRTILTAATRTISSTISAGGLAKISETKPARRPCSRRSSATRTCSSTIPPINSSRVPGAKRLRQGATSSWGISGTVSATGCSGTPNLPRRLKTEMSGTREEPTRSTLSRPTRSQAMCSTTLPASTVRSSLQENGTRRSQRQGRYCKRSGRSHMTLAWNPLSPP